MASRKAGSWRVVKSAIVLGAVLLALPASASATDLQDFERLIGKSAAPFLERPKSGCVCQETQLFGLAGRLDRITSELITGGTGVVIACSVPKFDSSTGELLDRTNCFTFVALPR